MERDEGVDVCVCSVLRTDATVLVVVGVCDYDVGLLHGFLELVDA